MAHTHDRTLLASLGFQDPDKKDRRHTLACQYLCQPEVATRLWTRILPTLASPPPLLPTVKTSTNGRFEPEMAGRPLLFRDRGYAVPEPYDGRHVRSEIEVKITRGRDYLVGFVDVALYATVRTGYYVWQDPHAYAVEWHPEEAAMYIEVKAGFVDVADIARQIATYRGNTVGQGPSSDITRWVVATCYRMHPADKATLAAKGIHHIWLGDGFDAYCRSRSDDSTLSDDVDL